MANKLSFQLSFKVIVVIVVVKIMAVIMNVCEDLITRERESALTIVTRESSEV